METEYSSAMRAEGTSPHQQWERDAAVEGCKVMCLDGTDTFLLPGLLDHRGPDGGIKTKTHG